MVARVTLCLQRDDAENKFREMERKVSLLEEQIKNQHFQLRQSQQWDWERDYISSLTRRNLATTETRFDAQGLCSPIPEADEGQRRPSRGSLCKCKASCRKRGRRRRRC